jgi:hypothetical protein
LAGVTWESDGAVVTHIGQVDATFAGRFTIASGGAMTVASYKGVQINVTALNTGVTIDDRVGFVVEGHTVGTGTIEALTGFATANYTRGATANIDLSMGDITPFANGVTGNWGVHQSHQKPNRFNGSVRYPVRTLTAGATVTLNDTDVVIVITGGGSATTINLPILSTNRTGMKLEIFNRSTGTVTVNRSSTNTIDILATSVSLAGFGTNAVLQSVSATEWVSRTS